MQPDWPVSYSRRGARYPRVAAVVARIGFPVLLTLALGATIAAIERGLHAPTSMQVCILGAYALLALGERLLPYRDTWLHSQNDLRTDTVWFATNGLLNRLLEAPVLAVAAVGGAWLATVIGFGVWPTQWPWLAQVATALLIAEFFEYWFHRGMHEIDLLWRFHATHHSAPRLYCSTPFVFMLLTT